MFSNLTKEILYYSVAPVGVVAIIIILLLIVGKKKNDDYFKFNYAIKVLLSILIGLIFSIMTGYTIWVYERVKALETVSNNIAYLALLIVIVLALFLSLIIITYKLSKSFKDEKQKEFQN